MNYDMPFLTNNLVLTALPQDALERLLPNLERVELPLGKNLFRAHEEIKHVYFPECAIASMFANTSEGESSEIAIIGREGAVGLDILMGTDSSPHDCVVQIPDGGYRISTAALREEFRGCDEAHDIFLLFLHKLMTQISQTTLCNRLHSLDERLPRWLLMCHDRIDGDEVALTQEFLALMLGVSRVSITAAASALQNIGHITYSRGRITINDRAGLEDSACECYQIVKKEYERITLTDLL